MTLFAFLLLVVMYLFLFLTVLVVVDDLPVDPNEKPKVRSGGVNKPAWKLKRKRARAEEKHSTRRSAKFY